MKGLIWPSKNKKNSGHGAHSSTSSTSLNRSKNASSTRSLSPSASSLLLGRNHASKPISSGAHGVSEKLASNSSVGGNEHPGHNSNSRRKSSATLPSRRDSASVYLLDSNCQSAKSVGSSSHRGEVTSLLSVDSSLNENTAEPDVDLNADDLQTNGSQTDTLVRESVQSYSTQSDNGDFYKAAPGEATTSISSNVMATESRVSLNKDNYDSLVFKSGWLNRSHGSTVINNGTQMSNSNSTQQLRTGIYTSGSNGNRESRYYHEGNESLTTVPEYRVYRAQLRGSVLNLYKSGLPSNVRFFDPTCGGTKEDVPLAVANKSTETLTRQSQELEEKPHILYLSETYPHPDLKLDSDGKIVAGNVESLCHAVLFEYPHATDDDLKSQKSILNLILILPLLGHFISFLRMFNHFGLTFTKHSSKLTNSSSQYYNISPKMDDLMTERLGLVVKTILEMFPSFLLDDQMFQEIIKLLDVISLHNDEISNHLKISVADKHNELNKLTAFSRASSRKPDETMHAKKLLEEIMDIEHFLKADLDELATEVHEINLKFDQTWAPRLDYSLLYDSKYINNDIVTLNPLVFNNKNNVHFLGRMLISHLFQKNKKFSSDVKLRAKVLTKWVEFGGKFEHLGDMVSWLAVATIICSIPILRLSSSWKYVPEDTLKTIFKDWVPTIAQLDRRQMSSKSTSSVFILAPPNLNNPFIKSNVISYFGDLIIHADDLPSETKFKYLERKINRTKNAFFKWQQRLEAIGSQKKDIKLHKTADPALSKVYQFWKFHISQRSLSIQDIMKLSVQFEPPAIEQKLYSTIGSQRSPLSSGSYLPILFNETFPNYSLFSQKSLICAAGISETSQNVEETLTQERSSLRHSKLSYGNELPQNTERVSFYEDRNGNQITGIINIDAPVVKEISTKQSNRQHMLKCIRDAFNIDSDIFHVSDDLIFKSLNDLEGQSRPSSVVIETPKRFSQQSSNNTNSMSLRDSQDISNRLSKTLENMDFFSTIGRVSETLKESVIEVVLRSGSLDKIYDLLVLTAGVFSKLIDTKDLEKYHYHKKFRNRFEEGSNCPPNEETIGLLDYAFVKLTMEMEVFTETFFNSYKSFTTTTSVIESLARRYVGAKSCAFSISQLLSSSSGSKTKQIDSMLNDTKFPVWDAKISHNDGVNLVYWAKVQVGTAEAIVNLVKNHYADFTDDLAANTTLLDLLKIMEQDINIEWPKRITNSKKRDSSEDVSETENLVLKLSELFSAIRGSYQKQLYRPLGISRTCRKVTALLNSFHKMSVADFNNYLSSNEFDDPMVTKFHSLKHDQYDNMLQWVYSLDAFISRKFELISKQDWFATFHILELFSHKTLTSLFSSALHSASYDIITSGTSKLDEMEIMNVFTWLSTLVTTAEKREQPLLTKLPEPVQLLIKLHLSLSTFFTVEVSDLGKSSEARVETCAIILQILNYVRWKNSSLDLFQPEEENGRKSIAPHIPCFIETAISNAIVSPESRYFEHAWTASHNMLSAGKSTCSSVCDILTDIEDKNIKAFIEIDGQFMTSKNLCPCPGWIVSRLLEISQFVPNMSIMNSKLINFDKRRFVNNMISNAMDLVPLPEEYLADEGRKETNRAPFGISLLQTFVDSGNRFKRSARNHAISESKALKYQEKGFFNEVLIREVEKTQRDHKKLESLSAHERDSKRSAVLQQVIQRKHRSSVIIPNLQMGLQSSSSLPKTTSTVTPNSITASSRDKRSSIVSNSGRNSVSAVSNSTHSHMSKKFGGFFKRPFSIGGFSSSASNNSLSSILIPDIQENGSVSPFNLPVIDPSLIQDQKPVQTLKTFEIKSILEVVNHNNNPSQWYSFKIVMHDGHEYVYQTTSAKDLNEWMKMIKASKRYAFHSKKFRGKTHNKMFGVPLEDVCEREGSLIPAIIVKLLEEIEMRGLDEVGLYRIPGSVGSVNALKNAFDEEGAVGNSFTLEDDRWFEINAIAGCFKMYLRELPDCLFSNERVADFAQLALRFKTSQIPEEVYKAKMVDLLHCLPPCYYQTLKRIVFHLNKVHQHVNNNRMDASNLAIVFSMSFIDQDDLASSMGSTLGAVQSILQHFIKAPGEYFDA